MEKSIIRDEIISSIDVINESVGDSILAVFCSVIQEYEKISIMMDNSEDDYFIYQEGQIWDTATGKDKVESGLMKLIAFIPRLFQGIINSITSVFNKTSEEDVDKNAKFAKNVLASASNEELQNIAKDVDKNTEGNLGFDPNKKEFVLKRGLKHIRNTIFIIVGLKPLFNKFIVKLKGGETQYDSMAKELMDVIKGNKSLDSESFYMSVETLHELVSDGYNASMGIRGLASEISMLLEKKMREDFADGKNIEKQAEAKNFLDSISKGSKHIMAATFGLKILSKALSIFGGPLYRKFRKGYIDEEDIELSQVSQEQRDLRTKLKSLKQQYKNATADNKRKAKKRADIMKLEDEIKDLEKKISQADYRKESAKNADERGDKLWNAKIDPNNPKSEKRHGIADVNGVKGNVDTKNLSHSLKDMLDQDVPDIV